MWTVSSGAARPLEAAPKVSPEALLSKREIEVLSLAAIGLTEAETAQKLKLSRRGVQFHLARAGIKLETPNKIATVARAIADGLITI